MSVGLGAHGLCIRQNLNLEEDASSPPTGPQGGERGRGDPGTSLPGTQLSAGEPVCAQTKEHAPRTPSPVRGVHTRPFCASSDPPSSTCRAPDLCPALRWRAREKHSASSPPDGPSPQSWEVLPTCSSTGHAGEGLTDAPWATVKESHSTRSGDISAAGNVLPTYASTERTLRPQKGMWLRHTLPRGQARKDLEHVMLSGRSQMPQDTGHRTQDPSHAACLERANRRWRAAAAAGRGARGWGATAMDGAGGLPPENVPEPDT